MQSRNEQFDWEIVEFVLMWQPYGQPPEEDSIVRFGMSGSRLHERFTDVVTNAALRGRPLSGRQRDLVAHALALLYPELAAEGNTADSGIAAVSRVAAIHSVKDVVGLYQPTLRNGVRHWPQPRTTDSR